MAIAPVVRAPLRLLPMLSENYPYITRDSYQHECYVRNLLQITQYLPELRLKILKIVVQHLTKFDVRAPRDEVQELDDSDDDDDMFDIEKVSVFLLCFLVVFSSIFPFLYAVNFCTGLLCCYNFFNRIDIAIFF